jgi:molybdopterin molybdotransferase
VISVEAALEAALALVAPLGVEEVALAEAAGRVLARPLAARRTQPPFAASAMDGYAVTGDPAAGSVLAVVGEAAAGRRLDRRIGPGEAARIFTGAPVPEGATRVILQEDTTRLDDGRVRVDALAAGPSHIRPAGQDFAAGEEMSPRRLHPHDIALLAAMNHAAVPVTRRPEVALIATGDELVMPGEEPGPDQIVCSNTFALKALVEAEGGRARMLPIARDDRDALRAVLGLAAGADLVVTVGGASVGDHDLVAEVAAELGLTRAFWKIAMRPGKPLMAGRMGDGTPLLGLPGNPVSAIVCGHLFLLPMLRRMLGLGDIAPPMRRVRLGADLPANGPRRHYLRARLATGPDGMATATPFADQDSSLVKILSDAGGLIVQEAGDPGQPAGALVPCLTLR